VRIGINGRKGNKWDVKNRRRRSFLSANASLSVQEIFIRIFNEVHPVIQTGTIPEGSTLMAAHFNCPAEHIEPTHLSSFANFLID
jgi:hypothetical protein